MRNPKHDRTQARTPTDLERKYNFEQAFGEAKEGYNKQSEQLRNLVQTFSIFSTEINKSIEDLRNNMVSLENVYKVGSIYIGISEDNPTTLFSGTWELIAQGHFIVSLPRETENDLTQLQETLDTCYVWKRTA